MCVYMFVCMYVYMYVYMYVCKIITPPPALKHVNLLTEEVRSCIENTSNERSVDCARSRSSDSKQSQHTETSLVIELCEYIML